jgi:hypothetical protein
VVNFEQILFANGRMLNLTEAPAQGGRAIQFDFLTGTHPGVRCPRSENMSGERKYHASTFNPARRIAPSRVNRTRVHPLWTRATRCCLHRSRPRSNKITATSKENRQMWFYVQMWLPIVTVALTAAICFSVASFIMGRSVKPHQL